MASLVDVIIKKLRKEKEEKKDKMLEIVFNGEVSSGMGMYSELQFPDHKAVPELPENWADEMFPGSLNVYIGEEGYPADLDDLGDGYLVQKLDNGILEAECKIPQDMIENNFIEPRAGAVDRGIAQIWNCRVDVFNEAGEKSNTFNAFAVRRIGSVYVDILELMSDKPLRATYDLKDTDRVKLSLFSKKP